MIKEKISGSVLVYTRPKLNYFLKEVARRVFEGEIIPCSDYHGLEPINFMNDFYKNYKSRRVSQDLDKDDILQITSRCRVLRLLNVRKSEAMIHAMYETIKELVEKQSPRYFLSPSVDNYITDIFARVCNQLGVFVIMLGGGSIANTITVTKYGEFNQIRIPSENDVNYALQVLMDDSYRITYLHEFNGYPFVKHFNFFIEWWLKYIGFKGLSWLTKDPLNYRYLASFHHVFEQGQSSLLNYRGLFFFDQDWEEKIRKSQFQKPALFIPLSYTPEMTVDYWLKDLEFVQYEKFIVNLCQTLSDAYLLIIKDHWAILGIREKSFYEKLKSIPNVILVPADVNSRRVMQLVDRVLLGAGTAGVESALRGKRVVTLCTPYYYLEGHYLCLDTVQEIKELPNTLESFTPPKITKEVQCKLVAKLLSATIKGSILPNNKLNTEENIQMTSNSLKQYLFSL